MVGKSDRLWAKGHKQRGAAMVEMALVAPFLILLLLGTIEFAYKFAQYNEVRHAAREGARYAAVSDADRNLDATPGIQNADVIRAVCNAVNLPGSTITITTTRTGATIGSTGTVRVNATVGTLTNAPIVTQFLNTVVASGLNNTATFRIEQAATWAAGSGTC